MCLVLPKEWTTLIVPEADGKLYDGTRIYIPRHKIQVANTYPRDENYNMIASKTHQQAMDFLAGYNDAHPDDELRTLALFEDEYARDRLDIGHDMFRENNKDLAAGYVLDFTKQHEGKKTIEGVNGQKLILREAYLRLPGYKETKIGTTSMATEGMVPKLSKLKLRNIVGSDGLKKLEELCGKDIYRHKNAVDVTNVLGHPQITFKDGEVYKGRLFSYQ